MMFKKFHMAQRNLQSENNHSLQDRRHIMISTRRNTFYHWKRDTFFKIAPYTKKSCKRCVFFFLLTIFGNIASKDNVSVNFQYINYFPSKKSTRAKAGVFRKCV